MLGKMMNDHLKQAIDKARAWLTEPDMRSPAMNFTSSVHAPTATPSVDRTRWLIDDHDRRARFSLKKASRDGELAVFEDFIWYGLDGTDRLQRRGALTITPVRLSEDGRTAIAVGPAAKNQPLIDLLKRHDIMISETEHGFTVRGRPVSFEGNARVARSPALAMKAYRYLEHEAYPEILENSLLRLFVEDSRRPPPLPASKAVAPFDGQPGRDPASEPRLEAGLNLQGDPASDGADAVGPSERRPKADEPSEMALDSDQEHAVTMALNATAMVIDGPPGTGKSAVITAIARRAVGLGRSVILTSTVASALEVALRRLAALGLDPVIRIGTPAEIAASPPPTVGIPDNDLLLIDECSRMSLEVAMPLLMRARAVVIIGDDKQLRPDHPGETILDRATLLGLPRTTLRFHYRSRDRSLISISNIMAYGMLLRTAPSPAVVPTDGIRLVDLLDGRAEAMSQGTANRAEAEAIKRKIDELRASGDPRSIGIITANQAQRLLIEQMIGKTKKAMISDEPLFVRAVQDSQGEERDIILISTVYDGRGPMDRFGLFDKPGSVERLNVMLSRSRSEMWIYTSFRRSTPRPQPKPSRGRITFEAMRMLLDTMTQAELRLPKPAALVEAARRLRMSVDNLGTVYGFRFQGDPEYRVGLIVVDDSRDQDHWKAIETQLKAIGWLTLRMDERDIRVKPASVAPALQAAISTASERIERRL